MEEIINSVMQSPENTNPNVLRSQLSKMDGGSGMPYEDSEVFNLSAGDNVENIIGFFSNHKVSSGWLVGIICGDGTVYSVTYRNKTSTSGKLNGSIQGTTATSIMTWDEETYELKTATDHILGNDCFMRAVKIHDE